MRAQSAQEFEGGVWSDFVWDSINVYACVGGGGREERFVGGELDACYASGMGVWEGEERFEG